MHIAGTNGKGTTAACLSALLHNKGISVGRFTSPHLVHRHDCITINERTINKDLFLEVEELVKKRDRDENINATSFELLTATAYEVFARERVEVAVVECGLGGRLDATNILNSDEVLCTVITTINKDHQEMLGDTLEAIALEKAGIMKPGVPMVIGSITNGPRGVIEMRAQQMECELRRVKQVDLELLRQKNEIADSFATSQTFAENLRTAVTAYEIVLKQLKVKSHDETTKVLLSSDELRQIQDQVEKGWKGRTQFVSIHTLTDRSSPVLVDGAHNEHAIELLRNHIFAHERKRMGSEDTPPITWVHAVSANRNPEDIMRSGLVRPQDRYVLTEFGEVDGMPWVKSHQASALRDHLLKSTSEGNIHIAATPLDALHTACRVTPEDQLIVIAGSLYLVGDAFRLLEEAEADRAV